MSDSYGSQVPSEPYVVSTDTPGAMDTPRTMDTPGMADTPGTLDTAKQEAADLKDTATEQAKGVVETAKDEASSVVADAKYQARDLYHQTKRELSDQANTQQQRVASGLAGMGDELRSMARNSDQQGMASDLVREVSDRVSRAGSWLGSRDFNGVLSEVKGYARRKPGTFILAAAVTGIVVGRLTRALASNASDQHDAAQLRNRANGSPRPLTASTADPNGRMDEVGDTPIYAQTSPAWHDETSTEYRDDRSDTV